MAHIALKSQSSKFCRRLKTARYIAVFLITATLCVGISVNATASGRHVQTRAPLRHLPNTHQQIEHRGRSYFFNAGNFYRRSNGVYITINAPIGAVVTNLPVGYMSFGIGFNRYFYYANTYYRPVPSGYEVIKQPDQAESLLAKGSDSGEDDR